MSAALTEAEYDLARAGVSDAEGLRELFRRSGWTQQRIATKEKHTQSWVSRIVRGENVRPHNHSGVPRTKLTKRQRGVLVHQVIAAYIDGHWHQPIDVANQTGLERRQVIDALKWIRASRALDLRIERRSIRQGWRTGGERFEFKIVPVSKIKTVSLDELTEKLAPIIKGLELEGRKHYVEMVPTVVLGLAIRLQRLLDEWAQDGAVLKGRER
jgi:hypothetical protein